MSDAILKAQFEHTRDVTLKDKYYIVTLKYKNYYLDVGWIESEWNEKQFMSNFSSEHKILKVHYCKDKKEYLKLKN